VQKSKINLIYEKKFNKSIVNLIISILALLSIYFIDIKNIEIILIIFLFLVSLMLLSSKNLYILKNKIKSFKEDKNLNQRVKELFTEDEIQSIFIEDNIDIITVNENILLKDDILFYYNFLINELTIYTSDDFKNQDYYLTFIKSKILQQNLKNMKE
jgi:hypothetical protein